MKRVLIVVVISKDCYGGNGCYLKLYFEGSRSNSSYQLMQGAESSASFHIASYYDLSSRKLFFGEDGANAKTELSNEMDIGFVSPP